MLSAFISALLAAFASYLPSPHDRDGLGLRIRLDRTGPFLERESISYTMIDFTLINYSKEVREHDALMVALTTGDLRLRITGPDGRGLGSIRGQSVPRDSFTVMHKLRPGEFFSDRYSVGGGFGYHRLALLGRYRMVASMKIDGKELTSPTIEFEVVNVPADAVLVSHNVPVKGEELAQPVATRQRAAVEQIKVGDQVWLVYRRFSAKGGVFHARRIAELPDKVEMAVEGTYGEWGPIAISYKTSPIDSPMKIVIQSSEGSPWGDEEERSWQEKLRAKKGLPPVTPPPRAIKP